MSFILWHTVACRAAVVSLLKMHFSFRFNKKKKNPQEPSTQEALLKI